MRKKFLETLNSQVGEGDMGVIGHVMTRLTMAKILKELKIDTSQFHFNVISDYSHGYYTTEARVSDICEFLDYVDADYEWDEIYLSITFPFKVDCCIQKKFNEALEYYWSSCEWFEESFCEGTGNQLIINLDEYEGVPIKFFQTYFELMKEEVL